jgi:crotonobetainyl-CoA:carnitine CoA-transferase CaiB-like acyl-CoA transferase
VTVTAESALADVRVVEIGYGIAGSFAARLLGDFGADVVKVEDSDCPDPVRSADTRLGASGPSALFEFLNWNKRSIALHRDDRAAAERLTASADIVISSLHPPDAAVRGLSAGELRVHNPRVVVTLISSFGQTGPDAELRCTDLVLQAMSGLMAISGPGDREPIRHGLRTAQYCAGLNAAYASLAGLIAARRTGDGASIDLAIRDCLSSELVMNHGYHVFTGVVQGRPVSAGDPFDGHPLPTARGFLSLQTSARQTPAQLADLLHEPRLTQTRFASAAGRATSAPELRGILSERLHDEAALDVFIRASERGLLSGAVQDAEDLLVCPQLRARELYIELQERRADGEPWRLPSVIARLTRTPSSVRRRAPSFGAHTDEIVREPSRVATRGAASEAAAPTPVPVKPLQGIRVVDLSVIFAVPYLAALLADLGAEVIKLEAPRRIDQTRTDWGGYFDNEPGSEPWNRGATFQVVNRGKRSFVADLATPAGRELLLGLVAGSDIVLDNFTPHVALKLGITYEQLSAVNPGLLMLSNTGYGSTGPWSEFKAQGTTLEATMGLMSLTGHADGPPARAGQSAPDFIACWAGLVALLAALVHRGRTGEGQWIDVGMYQLGPSMIPEALIAAQAGDPSPARGAAADPDALRSFLVPARDGWLAVAAQDHARLSALAKLLGVAPASPLLETRLREWAQQRNAWPATRELQSERIAAGPVLDATDLLADSQLTHRGFFEDVEIEQLGERRPLIGRPFRWDSDASFVGIAHGAPSFGADNDYVLHELLGLDPDDIQRLARDRVVTDRPIDPPPAAAMNLDGLRRARELQRA